MQPKYADRGVGWKREVPHLWPRRAKISRYEFGPAFVSVGAPYAMEPVDPIPAAPPGSQPPQSEDDSIIVLSDTVMSGVIRESVRRHVPVVQVVAERRGERPPPDADERPRPVTSAMPATRSLWSRCRRWLRKH
jgi:hypothetical protein